MLAQASTTIATTTTAWLASAAPSLASYIDPATETPKITQRVYLDVEVESTGDKGRIVIGVFGDVLPRVSENFVKLCSGNSYAGTTFYRVISDLTVQAGAIGDATGKTGTSSTGAPFEPDNFNIKHSREGLVSMVRGLSGAVDSRFFINIKQDAGWADDRYAAFGIVEEGMDIVHKLEKVDVKPPQNSPKKPVKIVASGVL